MKSYIDELKKEINELKDRVTKLEEEIKYSNNRKEQYELNNKKYSDYYEHECEPIVCVQNLKIAERDRFGRISSVNEEIKKSLDDKIIDYYEYKLMIRLAVIDKKFVQVKYLMAAERLSLEQIMEMLRKLEKLGYVKVIEK